MDQQREEKAFIDLEARLMEDVEGGVKRELQNYLEEWRLKVKRHMDSGLPPEDFSRFQRIEESLTAAINVIGRTWSFYHKESM